MALTQKQIRDSMGEKGSVLLNNLDQNVKIVTWVLLAIVASLMFALGAITNDYLAMKQASYQSLRDSVQEQNFKIETLTLELNKHWFIQQKSATTTK